MPKQPQNDEPEDDDDLDEPEGDEEGDEDGNEDEDDDEGAEDVLYVSLVRDTSIWIVYVESAEPLTLLFSGLALWRMDDCGAVELLDGNGMGDFEPASECENFAGVIERVRGEPSAGRELRALTELAAGIKDAIARVRAPRRVSG